VARSKAVSRFACHRTPKHAAFPELAAVDFAIHGLARRKNWLVLVTVFVTTHMLLMTAGEFVSVIQLVDDTLEAVCRTKLV
jgi:hypothetical protein